MTIALLRAAKRVWVSIPAWELMWKPYAFGRPVSFTWLPIPSNLNAPDAAAAAAVRVRYSADGRSLVGHLGTYGSLIAPLLSDVLKELGGQANPPRVLLLGSGAQVFAAAFLATHPDLTNTIHATGILSDSELAAHVAACDVMIQPYPDGISSRRTTAMAALALGVPVVTTNGKLSEDIWRESGAVLLADVGDYHAMAAHTRQVLQDPDARNHLREAGRGLYTRLFDLSRTIGALRFADHGKAA